MDKYGLIGYPLGHSFSKNYFNEKFENEESMPNTSTLRYLLSKILPRFSTQILN